MDGVDSGLTTAISFSGERQTKRLASCSKACLSFVSRNLYVYKVSDYVSLERSVLGEHEAYAEATSSTRADMCGSWYQSGGSGANQVKQEDEFLRKTWDFQNNGKRSSEILPAGNYEYPFDMIIPGSTPESVEGLANTWIVYRMKATIERGILQQNPIARKQVRIIRTLDTAALELAHAMVNYSFALSTRLLLTSASLLRTFGRTKLTIP